jgi:hypothetical protein
MKTTAITTQKQRSDINYKSATIAILIGFIIFVIVFNWQKENFYTNYPELVRYRPQLESDSGLYLVDRITKTRYAIAADISKGKESSILFSVTDSLGNKAVFIDQRLNGSLDEVEVGTWTAVGSFTKGAGFWSPDVTTLEKEKVKKQYDRLQLYFDLVKMRVEELLKENEQPIELDRNSKAMDAIEDVVFGVKVWERKKWNLHH